MPAEVYLGVIAGNDLPSTAPAAPNPPQVRAVLSQLAVTPR
jgi:hypothetical protein